jgi:hypothetical protein
MALLILILLIILLILSVDENMISGIPDNDLLFEEWTFCTW